MSRLFCRYARRTLNTEHMGVVLSDIHSPYHDVEVCQLAIDFINDQKPGVVHLLGDIVDFYNVSRFLKDPARKEQLQDELDTTRGLLEQIREAAPRARIIFSEGNHENRLIKYLAGTAKELSSLRCLRLPDLLGFDELNIEFRSSNAPYSFGPLMYTHGDMIRKHSGATAQAHFMKYGRSLIVGHSHRASAFHHTSVAGSFSCFENGCLSLLNPDYALAPDWQHAWSVVWTYDNSFNVDQILPINGKYIYHGQQYGEAVRENLSVYEVENLRD